MKQFSCGDVVPGCRRTFRGANDDAILTAVAAHAHDDHGLTEIPDALVVEVRNHIVAA
jgi:predicted small metal-binding protein